MASYISHYLTAKAVIEKSPENSVIKKYPDCFILGAQGGDLIFYAFGEFKGYGARTHKEKTYGLFLSLLDYCRKTDKESSVAYALGLLCHYALDSAAHPYVVHEAAERLTKLYPKHLKSCLHMMLETRIDVMMRERAESRGTTLNLKEVIPSTKRAALSLADIWSNAVDKVYGVDVPFKLLKKLPSRMYRYQALLDFAVREDPKREALYRELLTFDLYLRENAKSRPSFAPPFRQEAAAGERIARFYREEERKPRLLAAYVREGCDGRQMARMTHVECFRFPVWEAEDAEGGILRECEAGEVFYILFDYRERDPLHRQARTAVLPPAR